MPQFADNSEQTSLSYGDYKPIKNILNEEYTEIYEG